MPVADQSVARQHNRFLMNWYGSFVPRQSGCKLLPKLPDTTRVYEVIIVDLTQPRRYAFAPFASQARKFRDATAAQPHHVQVMTRGGKKMTRVWVFRRARPDYPCSAPQT